MSSLLNIYRISDRSYKKDRLSNATKENCLLNFVAEFGNQFMIIIADNVKDETYKWLLEVTSTIDNTTVRRINSSGNGYAANIAMDIALEYSKNVGLNYIYFIEDDYLHWKGSYDILLEGLRLADYVSLYDHPDKYLPGSQGGNPFIDEDGGEITKVFVTESTHWKLTNSTTMTFATSRKILEEDRNIWRQYTNHSHPNDFQCFLKLRERGRSLITPIPSYSTHSDIPWLAPLRNWESL